MKDFLTRTVLSVISLLLALVSVRPLHAAPINTLELQRALDASSASVGKKLDDIELVDQDGVRFRLSEYFSTGKPLVISYIYASCPHVCPAITNEFKAAVDAARTRLGNTFNALTVSFDPEKDTPEVLKAYGARYTEDFKSFRFATSDADSIAALLNQVGFYYKPVGDGSFDHIDMATVVSPDGTIFKQVYGLRTEPQNLENRLIELFTGKVSASGISLVSKLKFFCYKYDPYSGRYVIDYAVIAGFIVQSAVILTIILAVWGGHIRAFFSRLIGRA